MQRFWDSTLHDFLRMKAGHGIKVMNTILGTLLLHNLWSVYCVIHFVHYVIVVPFEHLLEAGILWPKEAVDLKKAKSCYNLQKKEVLIHVNTFWA
jgi:hypothetical protein